MQLVLFFLLKNPEVQTLLSRLVATYISDKSGSDIQIGEIHIGLTGNIRVKNLIIKDYQGQNLIAVENFLLEPSKINRKERRIVVRTLDLKGVHFSLRKASHDDLSNLAHFLQHFAKKDTTNATATKTSDPWTLICKDFSLRNAGFIYEKEELKGNQKSINFNDIELMDLDLLAKNVKIGKDTISARFQNLTFVEKSGFEVKEFSGRVKFNQTAFIARDMIITTNNSNLDFDLQFSYDSILAFSNFVNAVGFDLDLRQSELEMSDIGYFAEIMFDMTDFLELNGKLTGTVSNIYGKDFEVKYGDATSFKGTVRMNGLPNFYTTFIHADISELKTRATDVRSFALPGNAGEIPVPELLEKMETVDITGKFTGFPNDFVARASINSRMGRLKTDLVLKNTEKGGVPSYKGSLIATSLEAGTLFSAKPMLGRTSFYLDVNGRGFDPNSMDISAKGLIHSLVLNGYNYKNIKLDGNLKNLVFEGHTSISDQNLDFVFDGLIDFNEVKPRFDFVSKINTADLYALKLNKTDTLSLLSANLEFDFYATGIDDIFGSVSFDSVRYIDSSGEYLMNHLHIKSFSLENDTRILSLNSDFLDIDVEGKYTHSTLIPSTRNYIGNYSKVLASAINTKENINRDEQIYLNIRLKNTDELTRFFIPALKVSEGAEITGFVDFSANSVTIEGNAAQIDYGSLRFENWYLNTLSDRTNFLLSTGTKKALLFGANESVGNEFGADSLAIFTTLRKDSLKFTISWNDISNLNRNTGDLMGYMHLDGKNSFSAGFTNVDIMIDSTLWNVVNDNKILRRNNRLMFANVDFYSDTSSFSVSGGISRFPDDSLQLAFRQVNISELDQLIRSGKFNIDGILNGNLTLMNLYDHPNLLASISVNELFVNSENLGDMHLQTQWEDSSARLSIDLSFLKSGNLGVSEILSAKGNYFPTHLEQNFDIKFKLSNLGTHIFNPFLDGYATLDPASLASGEFHLTGSYAKPVTNGRINLMRTQFLINYLNTKYTATGSLDIRENAINVNNLNLYDIRRNQATCTGRITHNYFRGFELDILVSKENFSALNTTSRDNQLFYGTAIASGNVLITGPFDNIKMNINAKTEEGTRIVIPISSALSISDNDFIIFLNTVDKPEEEQKPYNLNVKGFTMDMDVSVTPEAVIELYLPYNMGNIKGNGSGEIGLGINPRGDFAISGDYAISSGTFFFNFEDLIGREFKIREGSRISWSGDPYDAVVDITATYTVKPTLAGLRLQTDSTALRNTRVEVDCNINLKNSLFNPDITFSIDFANVAEDTKQILFAALDTTDQSAMSQQIISLLVIGSFSYATGGPNIGSTGFKLLSNQLSDWLSRISKDVDIGINYQPGTELTEEELEVVLRTQLFNDRLSIDGNFGVRGRAREQNTSSVVGDIIVEYKITRDGRFRVKAFNRTNDISFLEDNAPYTQGVGVFFRKEFDRFSNLFKKDKSKQRDKKPTPNQQREQHALRPDEVEWQE